MGRNAKSKQSDPEPLNAPTKSKPEKVKKIRSGGKTKYIQADGSLSRERNPAPAPEPTPAAVEAGPAVKKSKKGKAKAVAAEETEDAEDDEALTAARAYVQRTLCSLDLL